MWTFLFFVLFLVIAWLTWKRVLALVVVAVARHKKLQLTMDAFTLTAASGVKLRLSKGPMEEVAVRDVQLSWGPGSRASGLFNFILSRGPRVRVTLNGVRLQLAPPPPSTAASSLDATPSPTASSGAMTHSESVKEKYCREDNTHPSIYFLNLIILELYDVAVVDKAQNVLAAVKKCHLSAATQRQTLMIAGLSILPQDRDGKEDLVSLNHVSVQHDGPLTALRRSSAASSCRQSLQKISLELGTVVVCLDSKSALETRSLLATFKNNNHKSSGVLSTIETAGVSRTSSASSSEVAAAGEITATTAPRSTSSGGGAGRLLKLRRTSFENSTASPLALELQALPREMVVQMTSLHVSGTSEEGLYGVLDLEGGIATCHVSSGGNTATPAPTASLVTGTATWQKLNCTVAADVSAPPGVELQCSSSEIGLTALPEGADTTTGTAGSGGASFSSVAALAVEGRVKINAMHTRIKHWDLQELAERLSKLSNMNKKEAPLVEQTIKPPAAVSISSYKLAMSLGEGSSLQFLDGDSECMWLSSLHSADLAMERAFCLPCSVESSAMAPTASATIGLGVSFQATEIAMATAQVGPHLNVPVDNLNKFALEKVLAAKLVRIVYSPMSAPSIPKPSVNSTSSSPLCVEDSNSTSNDGGSCDIATESVHAVLHPASVGALADVSRAIAALKTIAKQPATSKTSPTTSRIRASTTNGSAAPSKMRLEKGKGSKNQLPKLTFNFSNTLFVAPATVTIPAAHSSIGRIQLVHSTLGASFATAAGSIQLGGTGGGAGGKGSSTSSSSSAAAGDTSTSPASRTGELSVSDFSVVYSESLAAQKFPEDARKFKSYVKSTIIGLRNGTIVQENTIPSHLGNGEGGDGHYSGQTQDMSGGGGTSNSYSLYKRRLKLDQLTVIADADAMGCAIQASDDILAMYQLLKASTRHNSSWSRLRSTTTPSSQREEVLPTEPEPNTGSDCTGSNRASLTGLGTSGSELDAVDIVTLNELSRAAAAAADFSGDGEEETYHGGKRINLLTSSSKLQKIPLYVDIIAVKLSLPLSADIEVSLEVDALHAELAPARGVHLVRTEALNLTMKGKTVLRWSELAASLHTNSTTTSGGATPLPLQLLHPMRRCKPGDITTTRACGFTRRSSMAASLSREMSLDTVWSIHTSPNSSPTAQAAGTAGGSRQARWPSSGPADSTCTPGAADDGHHNAATTAGPSIEDTLPTGLLPYHRAGLTPWLQQTRVGGAEKEPSASGKRDSDAGKDDDTEDQKAEYLGCGPRSSLDLHVCGFEFTVPYDREPGPTQRYAEMYFKAVSAVFTHSVKVLRKKSQQSSRERISRVTSDGSCAAGKRENNPSNKGLHASTVKKVASSLFPLQLNLRIDGFAFRFEHHPMEKWFAVHGPLLRQASLQEHLWEEAVANVQNVADIAASPLHAGIVESAMAPSSAALAAAAAAAGTGTGDGHSIRNGVNGQGTCSEGPSSLHNEELLVHNARTATSAGATAGATTSTTATGTNVPASEAGSSHSGGGGGGGGGSSSSAAGGLGGDPGKEHAWEGLIRRLAAQYKAEAAKAAAARKPGSRSGASHHSSSSSHALDSTLPCDDLMLVSADVVQILAVVSDSKTTAAHDAALRHIIRLDPGSAAVELVGARKLHVDIVTHSFALNLASAPQPFISASRLVFSGPVAIVKQRTAPPTTSTRTLAVGAHRAVDIQTNVRGCKAPFKLYTDLAIEGRRLSVVFSPGYEPALAMMGMAGKRLAPSDPDKTAPRPPPVPWWDDLRYLWRGRACLNATPLRVVLAAHQLPTVDDTSERMLIRATAVEVSIGTQGDHSINVHGLSCSFYQDAGVESPGGAFSALPFVHAPVAKLTMKLGWKLPNGRLPQNHHLFPAAVVSGGETAVQAPILVAQEYKAEGLDVALEVYFGQGAVAASCSGGTNGNSMAPPQFISASAAASGAAAAAAASGTALGFLGDRQIAFLRDFSRNMRSTPAHVKACAKRGTFFSRKPRGGPPKKGLPRLLQLFKLTISASPLEIVHFTTDPSDPSAGLRIGASSASFGASWLLNQPVPSFLQLPPHLRKDGHTKRPSSGSAASSGPPGATRAITQDLFLNLGDISMHRDDPSDEFFLPDSPGAGKVGGGGGAVGNSTTTMSGVDASGDPLNSTFTSDPYSLGHKGIAAAAAAEVSASETRISNQDLEDADLEEGTRHAAALLQSLVERRREATAKDSSVLSATTLTVSRRLKPSNRNNPGEEDGGGGDDNDPNLDPVSAAFGQQKTRPLRVVVSNCRFLMDLGTRNAVWGAVSHMVAAFAPKPKLGRGLGGNHGGSSSPYVGASGFRNGAGGNTPGTAGRLLSPLGSLLSPAAVSARHRDVATEVHRQISNTTPSTTTTQGLLRASSTTSEIGATPETNELLSLLLQQREAAGGGTGSALPTPHASVGDEIPSQDGISHYGAGGGGYGGDRIDGTEDDEDAILEGDSPMTTPLDDVHSVLRYEVEVNDLQVMMLTSTETGPGPGRLLLAAKSGRLRGLTLPDGLVPFQITTLGLEDVQAYVSITDVDPHVSLSWLHVDKAGFSAPEDGGPAALRRVFNPICIDMRHSKAPSSSLTTRRAGSVMGGGHPRPMSLRSPTPGGGFGGSMMKTDELILKIPEIAAVMDGKEFEVVADVVSLLLTPGPTIVTITAEEKLLGEGENEVVEEARQKFGTVRQDLRNLRQQALEVQRCLGMTLQRSDGTGGGLLGSRSDSLQRGAELHAFTLTTGGGASRAPAPSAASAPGLDSEVSLTSSADLLPVMTAMREHLVREALATAIAGNPNANPNTSGGLTAGADAGHIQDSVYLSSSQPSSPGPTTPSHSRGTSGHHHQQQQHVAATYHGRRHSVDARRDQLTLLLRWVQEQESATAATYSSSKKTLRESKTAAGKEQVSRAASRVLVQLDRIVWQLCTPERTPFVQAALRGLTFDTHRNRDHSGSAKFIIHRVDIIDATGDLSEGPATPPGVILACWNPDASYEREPVLRIVTTMGVPTRTHTVFEHLDASLHPLSLHLTESIAAACWEYFFPKEDSKSRQEAFSQSVGSSSSNAAAGGGNINVGGGRGRRGSTAVATDAMNSLPGSGGSPMAGASGAFGTSPLASGRSAFADYRGSPPAATAGGGAGGGSNASSRGQSGVQRSLLLGDMAGDDGSSAVFGGLASGGSTPSAAASSAAAFRGGGGGGGIISASSAAAAGAGAGGGGGGMGSKKVKQQQQQPVGRTRKRFVYVKLNRAHMRITYQGYPIGIKDRILVINSYTCENLDGRWRDLLANVKQKAILSAVWSGLGLQGRKIRELMDGAAPAVPSHQSGVPGEDGRGAKGLLAKMGLAPKTRKGEGAVAGQPEMSQEELKALSKKRALFGNHVMKNMAGPLRSGTPASTTGAAAAAAAATSVGAGAVKSSGGTSAGASPSGSAASTPRISPHTDGKTVISSSPPPGKTSKDSPPHASHDPPQHAQQLPSAQRQHPTNTTNTTVTKPITQQRHAAHAVPVLDLQRPLPPEDPVDALGDHQDREPSLSPLEAGIVAAATENTNMTALLESIGRSPRSSTSSPTKKLSLSRADSNTIPRAGSSGTYDSVTALLGQAFHQQQTQHSQHGPRHEEEAAAQLLGIPSPRKQGGGGAGKTAKGWMAKMTGK